MSRNSTINIPEIKRIFKLRLKDRYKIRGVVFSTNYNSNKNNDNNSSNSQNNNIKKIYPKNKTLLDLKISQLMLRYSSLKKMIRNRERKEEEERKMKANKKIKKGIHFSSYYNLFLEENKSNDNNTNINNINSLEKNGKEIAKAKKEFDILVEKIENKRKKLKLYQKYGSILNSDSSNSNQKRINFNFLISNSPVNQHPLNNYMTNCKKCKNNLNFNSLSPKICQTSIPKNNKQILTKSKSGKNIKRSYKMNPIKTQAAKYKPIYLVEIGNLVNKYDNIQAKCEKIRIDHKISHFSTYKEINEIMDVQKDMLMFPLKNKYLETKFPREKNQRVDNKKFFITRLKQNVDFLNSDQSNKTIEK